MRIVGREVSRRGQFFASICLFSFLVNFGRVSFAPLVDVFIRTLDVGEGTAGAGATAVWVGSALTRLPTGYLLTIVARHRAILAMGVALSAAAAFTALAPGIALIGLGALLIGLASGVFYIAANPLVSELYPDRVGWAVGVRGTSSQLAAVSASPLVLLAVALGSWRLGFAALSVLALCATAVFWLTARRADLPDAGSTDRDLFAAVRAQWRLIVAGIVFVGLTGFVWQGVFNFYVSYLRIVKGFDPGTANAFLSLVFVAGVPSFYLSGRIVDRVQYVPYLLGVLSGIVLGLLAMTAASGPLGVAAVSIALGLVVHALFPAADAYLLDSFPDENRASAYSAYSAVMMLMQAPGSAVLGGLIASGFEYTSVFRAYAIGLAAMVGVMALLYRAGRLPAGN